MGEPIDFYRINETTTFSIKYVTNKYNCTYYDNDNSNWFWENCIQYSQNMNVLVGI